jgi:hypothetical protein
MPTTHSRQVTTKRELQQDSLVLLIESPDGGWGVAGHANTGADLATAVRAEIAAAQSSG